MEEVVYGCFCWVLLLVSFSPSFNHFARWLLYMATKSGYKTGNQSSSPSFFSPPTKLSLLPKLPVLFSFAKHRRQLLQALEQSSRWASSSLHLCLKTFQIELLEWVDIPFDSLFKQLFLNPNFVPYCSIVCELLVNFACKTVAPTHNICSCEVWTEWLPRRKLSFLRVLELNWYALLALYYICTSSTVAFGPKIYIKQSKVVYLQYL